MNHPPPPAPHRSPRTHQLNALLCALVAACASPERGDGEVEPASSGRAPVELRLGMAYGPRVTAAYENRPTPLFYGAGFLPKVPVFETLVGMDADGAPTPGLATSWSSSPDGRIWVLHLRPEARFHDGRRCDAEAVAAHFRRLGSDEDMFIGMFRCLRSVEALDATRVRFELSRAYPLLADLPLVNPNAIVVPEAERDAEPALLIGSGPFRFESFAPMERAVYRRFDGYDGGAPRIGSFSLELFVGGGGRSAVLPWALERGHVDAIVEGWSPAIPRDRALRLAEDGAYELIEGRGSAVTLLVLQTARAPFDRLEHRRFVAQVVDRAALIDHAEQGFGDPVDTLFAPGVSDWPARAAADPVPELELPEGLRDVEPVLVVPDDVASMACGMELARQCWARGLRLRVETTSSGSSGWDRVNGGDYDLLLTRTWGMPYDPHTTMIARLLPQPERPTAVETVAYVTDPELTQLVEGSWATTAGSRQRRATYAAIQERLDATAAVVPLYVARRIAVVSPRVRGLALGPHGYGLDLSRVEVLRDAPAGR